MLELDLVAGKWSWIEQTNSNITLNVSIGILTIVSLKGGSIEVV